MGRDELGAWLRLLLTPGVGASTARRLLSIFGLPQALFAAPPEALHGLVTPAQAKALATEPQGWTEQFDTTWEWLHAAGQPAHNLITLADPRYPSLLLETEDPPLMLYVMGPSAWVAAGPFATHPCLAMVGSRNPTPQGAENARAFAAALASAGWTIVSGLALGVDAAAHEGALQGANAQLHQPATIAVVGTGLDRVYPRRNLALAHRIAAQGLLVSEYPLGTPPLAANFPKRNRIIAGLSRGTLVVEAALASGSLITARQAAEQGREVFAIPGSIHAPQSRGCHALIRQGAKLVESTQDVLEELASWTPASASGPESENQASTAEEPAVLTALGFDPMGLDTLMARTGLDAAHLQTALLELELEGLVARLPGGLFQRMHRA